MTDAEKIQIAADIIAGEMFKRGTPITLADCLALARRLHEIWTERRQVHDLKPGEIAQKFRERYEASPDDGWCAGDKP
jgi:hypothetical protein